MTRHIVFLDIDGVINSTDSRKHGRKTTVDGVTINLDPEAIARVNRIVRPGVEWILSSAWRNNREGHAAVQYYLEAAGFRGVLTGATPSKRPPAGARDDAHSRPGDRRVAERARRMGRAACDPR